MELLTAKQMREVDRHCIEDLGIPGPALMENAGLRCVELLDRELGPVADKQVVVCAGKGNNGGDGFVLARHLLLSGASVRVFLTAQPADIVGDARINLDALLAVGGQVEPYTKSSHSRRLSSALATADVGIDALLGTGVSGAPREPAASAIRALNRAGCRVLAVDLPSGLNADTGEVAGDAIRADWTVTFARPKTGLLLHPAAEYCGALFVGSLGVPENAFCRLAPDTRVLTSGAVRDLLPPGRSPDTHKGDYGRVFVVGGSEGMSGAIVLACRAALRAGAGLVTAVVPRTINPAVEAALIEATSLAVETSAAGAFASTALTSIRPALRNADAVAVGPGLSRHEDAAAIAVTLLTSICNPVVLDADGLTAFAGRLEDLRDRRGSTVLTPHPGEAAALLGTTAPAVQSDRRAAVERLAEDAQCVVVLKGSRTLIASPRGELSVNTTGNPGMATGGSGDVLTGLIAALLAQRLAPYDAACAGAHLHGVAGDLAADQIGMAGVVAGDLVERLPAAVRELSRRAECARATPRLLRIV